MPDTINVRIVDRGPQGAFPASPANTVVGNPTGSTAPPTNISMASLPISTATQTALDAKQDASENLDRLDGTAAQQRAAIEVEKVVFREQTTEGVGVTLNSIDVASPGFPPWKTIMQSIWNGDGTPGTYNHIVALGFNTSVESFHGNTIPGKPTAILGFESNFKDGANEYGPELYLEFANLQRPFYARQIFDPATTTIAVASNGAALPQATINVASTANFPQYGWIFINGQQIAYTGKTATSFTGCTGGTGTLTTGQAVESVFRDNSNVQIDIGSDGIGSFNVYAGKLNPTYLSFSATAGWTIRGNVDFQNGILIIPPSALQTNGSKFAPARRYLSEDFGANPTITIPADFVDVYQARINLSGTVTFAPPANPTIGQELTIIVVNRFGGTTLDVVFDPVFKLAAWGANPTPTFNRKITFVYNGTNWTEVSRSEAIPN